MRKIFNLLIFLSCYLVAPLPTIAVELSRPGGLPDDVDPGELKVLNIDGQPPEQTLKLPLQHTDVKISVAGFVARATVTQHYTNPFDKPIEAVYAFPLPHKAAVDGMTMHVGARIIRGIIKKREEARQIYQQAKTAGKRTALLEQERPNIFTQSVGNIMPGDKIQIEITYVDLLEYRDEGAFELVFPMVVGPRYIPGTPQGHTGSGFAANTDQVPDASHITPPVLKPGERSGHDIALAVNLDAHVKIRGLHSISHKVDITEVSENKRTIALRATDAIPNKDFVLRYEVAGRAPEVAVIAHHDPENGGYFTFIALPQKHIDDSSTVPRDLIFILDTSGSMSGQPIEQSKQAMYKLLAGMRAADRFNIIRFAGDTGTLWPAPRQNTPANLAQARSFIEAMRGMGGTAMRRGISAALAQPAEAGRMRLAFLLTDGYVGNESGILASIEDERRGARIFTLGIGSSVNRYLLDQAAVVGLGEAFYVRQDEDATGVIDKFFKRVDRPNLAHLQIDWKGLDVSDLTPARIPDLWEGQPILVHGRYKNGGSATVILRGVLGDKEQEWNLKVTLPTNAPENEVMATVWARAKVRELMTARTKHGSRGSAGIAAITDLGLQYRIMTQWTSFVAVEESTVNEGGKQRTVVQPVELPEGVDYQGVFGNNGAMAAPPARSSVVRSFRSSRALAMPSGGYGTSSSIARRRAFSPPQPSAAAGYAYAPPPPAPASTATSPAASGTEADSLISIVGNAISSLASGITELQGSDADSQQTGFPALTSNIMSPEAAELAITDSSSTTSTTSSYTRTNSSKEDTATGPCKYHYVGLSVSGELMYPDVVRRLRELWPEVCTKFQHSYSYKGLLQVKIALTVGTDGQVKNVALVTNDTVAKSLVDAIQKHLQQLSFMPTPAGESLVKFIFKSK